jgi:ornithine carbamoyltransferase
MAEVRPLAGALVAFVGDFNNVARALAEVSVMLGAHVRLGCPDGYCATVEELARIDALGTGTIEQTADPLDAVKGADFVHTDTWTSMGQESEKATRKEVFGRYQVNAALMAHAAPDARFLHCMPAYRGWEVTPDVMDGARSLAIRQGHNRLHSARGAMAFLLGVR